MYNTASFLIEHFWGKPHQIADALGVLLLTWNNALYRYGTFDFNLLENTLERNQQVLDSFRTRNIIIHTPADDVGIRLLFADLLESLEIRQGSKAGTRSPVAVAKALHLLAPAFFPLWDFEIARNYGCRYSYDPAGRYLTFLGRTKELARALERELSPRCSDRTLIKIIDEFNYAKYTKRWV